MNVSFTGSPLSASHFFDVELSFSSNSKTVDKIAVIVIILVLPFESAL